MASLAGVAPFDALSFWVYQSFVTVGRCSSESGSPTTRSPTSSSGCSGDRDTRYALVVDADLEPESRQSYRERYRAGYSDSS